MNKLALTLGTKLQFTSAYHAQSNGNVEAVCREVIRACRALISEHKLGPSAWPWFTNTIQMIINHSKSDQLGKKLAQVTAFTLLPEANPLADIFPDDTFHHETKILTIAKEAQFLQHQTVRVAIEKLRRTSAL